MQGTMATDETTTSTMTSRQKPETKSSVLSQKADAAHKRRRDVTKKVMQAAVKGFVTPSDRTLLLSMPKNPDKRYQCPECDQQFAIARVLEAHIMLEHNVRASWTCSECGMQFIKETLYHRHMVRSHSVKPFVCQLDQCAAVFFSKTKLSVHQFEHHHDLVSKKKEKLVFKCSYCPAQFPHQSKLRYHTRKHTGEQPYKCSHCPKTFRSSSHRTQHIKIKHQRIRNHLCDFCGKKFLSAEELKNHSNSHRGERPYHCSVCSRAFTKQSTLRVHMRQHTGEKPYVCDQCGQSFTVRVSLRSHLKSKHGIIVDTSMYRRPEEPLDDSTPQLGRPRKKDQMKFKAVCKEEKEDVESKPAPSRNAACSAYGTERLAYMVPQWLPLQLQVQDYQTPGPGFPSQVPHAFMPPHPYTASQPMAHTHRLMHIDQ